jgi:hypothetical protein
MKTFIKPKPWPVLALLAAWCLGAAAMSVARHARADITIANRPPAFGFYDVDQRERWLRRTIAALSGDSHYDPTALNDAAAQLIAVKQDEKVRRARHHRLTRGDLRALNAALDRAAQTAGLDKPPPH